MDPQNPNFGKPLGGILNFPTSSKKGPLKSLKNFKEWKEERNLVNKLTQTLVPPLKVPWPNNL